jgi:hypothetical protein
METEIINIELTSGYLEKSTLEVVLFSKVYRHFKNLENDLPSRLCFPSNLGLLTGTMAKFCLEILNEGTLFIFDRENKLHYLSSNVI